MRKRKRREHAKAPKAAVDRSTEFPEFPALQFDWRWDTRREVRMSEARVSAGLPREIRAALEQVKAVTGTPFAETVRRCLAQGLDKPWEK